MEVGLTVIKRPVCHSDCFHFVIPVLLVLNVDFSLPSIPPATASTAIFKTLWLQQCAIILNRCVTNVRKHLLHRWRNNHLLDSKQMKGNGPLVDVHILYKNCMIFRKMLKNERWMNAFNMHCHLLNVEARNDNSTLKIYIAKVNIASPSNLEPSNLPPSP